jgi:hypothetical protein
MTAIFRITSLPPTVLRLAEGEGAGLATTRESAAETANRLSRPQMAGAASRRSPDLSQGPSADVGSNHSGVCARTRTQHPRRPRQPLRRNASAAPGAGVGLANQNAYGGMHVGRRVDRVTDCSPSVRQALVSMRSPTGPLPARVAGAARRRSDAALETDRKLESGSGVRGVLGSPPSRTPDGIGASRRRSVDRNAVARSTPVARPERHIAEGSPARAELRGAHHPGAADVAGPRPPRLADSSSRHRRRSAGHSVREEAGSPPRVDADLNIASTCPHGPLAPVLDIRTPPAAVRR